MKILLLLMLAVTAKPGTRRLASPSYISPAARAVLDERMQRHGESAMRLSISVVLLEYEETGEVAQAMVDQAGIARPRANERDTLNAQLPTRFFDFQDQLRARAKTLADAAIAQDDAAVAAAYGNLTATCVACHSAYLKGPIPFGK